MNNYYAEMLFSFLKSEDSSVKFKLYERKDLLHLRKKLYLFLKRLDNYFKIELTQNTHVVMPSCPILL